MCGYVNRCGLCGRKSAPGPEYKFKDKQVRSNRDYRDRGQAGVCSPSADVAMRWHKPAISCFCRAAAAGQQKRPADLAGFSTLELFPSTPKVFFPVPSGCWGCSRDTRQRVATKMMGEMVPGASASLPARGLFGSESSRGSARSYGRCFGTGMEQPRRCFVQQGTGAAKVANMRVSWAGGEILQPKGCAGSGPSSGGGNATCAMGPGRAMAATSRNRGGATPLLLSTARHCFRQKKKKKKIKVWAYFIPNYSPHQL